jgi:GMP synthase-like glutamine amidotransferase
MRSLLFVRCDGSETFGVGRGAVEDAGGSVVVWDAIGGEPRPDPGDHAGVVLFGSSYNVEHADEQPFIREIGELIRGALDAQIPFLGLCFGAQALTWALGGAVTKAPTREVGFEPITPTEAAADDPLLSHYEPGDRVFQWHMDTFELPEGAVLLATGERVRNQAFRLGETTWATQFHLEIDRPEIELWIGEDPEDVEAVWGKSPERILAESDELQQAHDAKGREVFARFTRFAAER